MAHRKNQPPPRSFQPRPSGPRSPRPGGSEAPPPSLIRNSETFEATFLGHPEGTGGFLRPLNARRGQGLDLLVDWREGHGAIHGDKVQAEITGTTYDGRPKAKVLKVVSRNADPIPAHLQKQEWGWRAIPLEPRLSQIVSVPPTDLAGDGDLVSVLLDPDPQAQQIRGVVLARLGRPTDLRIENKLTAALYNLRTEFPDAVMEELAPFPTSIPEDWIKGREDLRDLLTVTVDPPTAKDFDDAISLEILPEDEGGGWLLGVHIADVSHYVTEGGPLDQEALLRGTSVYFPDQCIPMLPERLSGELCSLREGVDRLTMTAWITLDAELRVVETRLSESVIRSRKRLTYDQVKEACIDAAPAARQAMGFEVEAMLAEALRVSRSLTRIRLGRGALNLDTDETEFIFGEDGRPVDARRYGHHDAHRMIEEFMLLANEAVATFFTRKKIPAIYRIHDNPDPLKLEAFKEVASAFGLLRPFDPATPEVLNAMLDKIRGGPLEAMLNTLLVRSLKKAMYSVDNIGHSGLALQDYLHFTSPIRRYPDLSVHRELRKVLRGKPLPDGLHSLLAVVAKQCSDTEQTATEAERENDKWKTCLIMRTRIGNRYEGRIQGFSLKAAFIRLDSPFVEVGVPLGALGGAFTVDENRTKASTAGSGVVLTIGDAVKVEITGVDEDLRRVSAWVVEARGKDAKGKALTYVPSLAAPSSVREADFVQERAERTPSRTGGAGATGRAGGHAGRTGGQAGRAGGPSSRPGAPSSRAGGTPRPTGRTSNRSGDRTGSSDPSGRPAERSGQARAAQGGSEGRPAREGGPRAAAAKPGHHPGRPPERPSRSKPPKGSVRGTPRRKKV